MQALSSNPRTERRKMKEGRKEGRKEEATAQWGWEGAKQLRAKPSLQALRAAMSLAPCSSTASAWLP
jgi:hypothetical protein